MVVIKDRVFFVTGAASQTGLGAATVQELVRQGAYVGALDLNEDGGKQIEREHRERVKFVRCDVRDEDDVMNAIKVVTEAFEGIAVSGLCHCGGVGMVGKTVGNNGEPFDLSTYKDVVDINLTGSFNIARHVAAHIVATTKPPPSHRDNPNPPVEEDRGVIILTSSVSGTEGQMGQVAYASSKAGVEGLTLPMARDLARYGIRVVCIAPSLFSTSMGKNTSDKVKKSLLSTTLFPVRFGEAREYAHLALAIFGNQMLNGSVIRLDGGSRMAKM